MDPKLSPDQAAWLPIARKVLTGHYDLADISTKKSIIIGLRHIYHPLCQQAHKHFNPCQSLINGKNPT